MAETADWDGLGKALEVMASHEMTVNQILTLAVEYEASAITAERFADRVCGILRRSYSKFVPWDACQSESAICRKKNSTIRGCCSLG